MLRTFGVLPGSEAARALTDRDFLRCALHLILDEEERLDQLCPACRARAEERRCAVCGAPLAEENRGEDPAFDWARYERLKRGERS